VFPDQTEISVALLNTLTNRDIDAIETATGISFMTLNAGNAPWRLMVGIAYVISLRTNPDLTFDDCLDWSPDETADALNPKVSPLPRLRDSA
jgi:hypothetical protein